MVFFINDSSFKDTFQSIEENIKETIMGEDTLWDIQLKNLNETVEHFDVLIDVNKSFYI
jgi:hypothetical protein